MAGEIELLPTRVLTYMVGHDNSGLAGRAAITQANLNSAVDPGSSNDSSQGYGVGSLWQNSNTGRVFIARSVALGAAVWALVGQASHPGYIVGNWYTQLEATITSSGGAPGAGSIRLYPAFLKERVTINALGIRVNTLSAGGNVQAAIYATNSATGKPTGTPLVSTTSMSTAAAGNVNATVSVQLEPGMYWWASNCDNGTAVFESLSNGGPMMSALIGSTTQSSVLQSGGGLNGLSVAQTFGTWPDLTSGSFAEVIASSTVPIIQFKIGSVP